MLSNSARLLLQDILSRAKEGEPVLPAEVEWVESLGYTVPPNCKQKLQRVDSSEDPWYD